MDESPPVNRNVFAILLAISIIHLVFAFAILVTHGLTMLGEIPVESLAVVLLLPPLVQILLLGILIYAGLYLGKSVGLGAPLLESWARGEPVRERAVSALKISLAVGLGVAAAKVFLDLLIFSPFVPSIVSQWMQVPLLSQLHIPFMQGIGDEMIYRLFGVTLIVWILWKIRGAADEPVNSIYWAGIVVAGLIPVVGLVLSGISGLVLLQCLAIILAGAIPFGWLYWKRGIESALVAHFVSSVALVLLSLA